MARFAEVRRIRPFCLTFMSVCWILCGFISWQLHQDARFQRQVHADWLCLFTCSFDVLVVAVSICEQLNEYQHYCVLYSTFAFCFYSLNQRTNQPTKQAVIIEKPLKLIKKFPQFFYPRIFWNPKVHYCVHKSAPLVNCLMTLSVVSIVQRR